VTEVIPWLQQLGAVGAVLIVAGIALKYLHTQLAEAQEKRIQDAQAATAKLLELVQKQHEQMMALVQAIDGNVDAIREIRILLDNTASVAASRGTAPRMPLPTRR
jgi:hypothetical protein